MKFQLLIPQYKETDAVIKPLLDSVAIQQNVPFDEISRRVTNITTRGIVFHKNETLKNVYEQRAPLYERYADLTVDVSDGKPTIEQTVEKAAELLKK